MSALRQTRLTQVTQSSNSLVQKSEYEIALESTPTPEPVPYDDEDRIRHETIRGHVELLLGMGDAETVWRFLLASAYDMSVITIEEMAEKMGISERQAYRIVGKMSNPGPM